MLFQHYFKDRIQTLNIQKMISIIAVILLISIISALENYVKVISLDRSPFGNPYEKQLEERINQNETTNCKLFHVDSINPTTYLYFSNNQTKTQA
jgi:hypothetical protein